MGQTVLDCLAKAAPSAGARVLILGASGGVGTSAVQIMKAEGLFVIGVCSGKNAGLVTDLGADQVVDYTAEDWSETLAGDDDKVDLVFDFAPSGSHSTESWEKATKVLAKGGRFITISGSSADGSVTLGSIISGMASASFTNTFGAHKYYSVLKVSDALKLQRLAKLADEGKLKPVIDTVYPWEVFITELCSASATASASAQPCAPPSIAARPDLEPLPRTTPTSHNPPRGRTRRLR